MYLTEKNLKTYDNTAALLSNLRFRHSLVSLRKKQEDQTRLNWQEDQTRQK